MDGVAAGWVTRSIQWETYGAIDSESRERDSSK